MVSDSVLEHPDRGSATGEEDDSQTEEEDEEEEEEDEDGYVVYKAQKVGQLNFFHLTCYLLLGAMSPFLHVGGSRGHVQASLWW